MPEETPARPTVSAQPQASAKSRAPAKSKAPEVVLAFDLGRRRIGVACGDTASRSASPLGAVAAGPGGPRWDAIESLLREWQPGLLVVGLPYNADGSENAAAGEARDFARELTRRYALPVELVDERYSSLEAGARLKGARASGLRRRRVAKTDVDAAAACIILERWLGTL
jgi:putative Holliday junction resolvase